jgi:sugar/nucleoside kinase (ribokinase family)
MTKLLCVGNITHDELLWVDSLPKLDDVGFVTQRRESVGGRGGIVAVTAAAAGVATALCTVISPAGADLFLPMLRRAGVDVAPVTLDPSGQGVFRVIVALGAVEQNCVSFFIPCDVKFQVDEAQRSAVERADVVYVTTHKASFNEKLLQHVRPTKQRVIHNASSYLTRRPTYANVMLRTATTLIANTDEYEFLLRRLAVADAADLFERAPHLDAVFVTRGRDGVTVYPRTGEPLSLPAEQTPVKTPVGAGDAFAAGVVAAICFGHEVETAARVGLRFAAISIASQTSYPDLDQIATASSGFNLGRA